MHARTHFVCNFVSRASFARLSRFKQFRNTRHGIPDRISFVILCALRITRGIFQKSQLHAQMYAYVSANPRASSALDVSIIRQYSGWSSVCANIFEESGLYLQVHCIHVHLSNVSINSQMFSVLRNLCMLEFNLKCNKKSNYKNYRQRIIFLYD